MNFEREKLKLQPLNIEQIRIDGRLKSISGSRSLLLDPLQIEILDLMQRGSSVEEIVQHFFRQGICVPFARLREMLKFLVDENLMLNASVRDQFERGSYDRPGILRRLAVWLFPPPAEPLILDQELRELPFFRTLKEGILSAFCGAGQILSLPAGTLVCRAGARRRNLYVLLRGEAVVRRENERIAHLSQGAVFGEVGFFLNEPRSADVITMCPSVVARISYIPGIFDSLIKKEQARDLQKRFWVVHALLRSPLFREMPGDCFDALIFSGEIKSVPAGKAVCRMGEPGLSCYIVVQGEVTVSQNGSEIRRLGQGDCFGELALIASGGARTADVTTESETVLLEIPAPGFYRLLGQNLYLACEFERVALNRIRDDRTRSAAQTHVQVKASI